MIGEYRDAQSEQRGLDDSGYDTPAKRTRIETSLGSIPEPIIDELESGYNEVYLVKAGALFDAYKAERCPPVMNDPLKMVKALKVSPGYSSGLRAQIDRMSHYRRFPVNQDQVEVVDLTTSSN